MPPHIPSAATCVTPDCRAIIKSFASPIIRGEDVKLENAYLMFKEPVCTCCAVARWLEARAVKELQHD